MTQNSPSHHVGNPADVLELKDVPITVGQSYVMIKVVTAQMSVSANVTPQLPFWEILILFPFLDLGYIPISFSFTPPPHPHAHALKVHAAALNPVDYKIMGGYLSLLESLFGIEDSIPGLNSTLLNRTLTIL